MEGRDEASGEPNISMDFTEMDALMSDNDKFTVLDIALDQSARQPRYCNLQAEQLCLVSCLSWVVSRHGCI
jgi:hypothetical protein